MPGLAALGVMMTCAVVPAGAQNAGAGGYVPAPVQPRAKAAYVLADGSVQIVAAATMTSTVQALNELFMSTHPGLRLTLRTGDNYSAMAALTFDRTAFAPMGSEYTRIGLGDNLKIASEPVGFRIAHATLTGGAGVPALGVIVNANNPIESLSMAQVTRIFAVGAGMGDIATWGQAGLKGELADRTIDPVGPYASDYLDSDDPQAGEFLSLSKMGGLTMNHRYVAMAHYDDVVRRVSEDPAAIGITALNRPLGKVRVVALKATDAGRAATGSAAEIASGRYPLDRFVYVYLRVGKGMPLDELGKDYMRMVLSDAGQQVIAADAAGYLPLSAGELAQERARVEQ